jgi:hypothetical protein
MKVRSPLLSLPGVGISAFIPDILHCIHLGAYQRAFGSILKYLTHYKLSGNVEANLAQVWAEIQAAYQADQGLKQRPQSMGFRFLREPLPHPTPTHKHR